ncbi:GNAT family N-acetyltransferase [Cohnella sp.]|uniref:GNAT family N-acetyltransferase n=1 Tax=Cohnella sp. TaxID=1883426 RepID=UPI003566BC08
MNIRSFQLGDYIVVSTLFESTLSGASMEETIASFAKHLYCDSDLIIVAQRSNRVIGVIIGTIHNQQGICYRIAIDENCRNKGVESALMESLVGRFQNRNVVRVGIMLDEANVAAMGMYHSLGFTKADFVRQTG